MSEAAWYKDPLGRNELRYYDGTTWTEHVSAGGVTETDSLTGLHAPSSLGSRVIGSVLIVFGGLVTVAALVDGEVPLFPLLIVGFGVWLFRRKRKLPQVSSSARLSAIANGARASSPTTQGSTVPPHTPPGSEPSPRPDQQTVELGPRVEWPADPLSLIQITTVATAAKALASLESGYPHTAAGYLRILTENDDGVPGLRTLPGTARALLNHSAIASAAAEPGAPTPIGDPAGSPAQKLLWAAESGYLHFASSALSGLLTDTNYLGSIGLPRFEVPPPSARAVELMVADMTGR